VVVFKALMIKRCKPTPNPARPVKKKTERITGNNRIKT
jgi:hypothetical protein